MKKYNIPNYIRYKNDLIVQLKKIEDKPLQELNEEQLQWKFMLLVENIKSNKGYGKEIGRAHV